jgi:hypothetical protein
MIRWKWIAFSDLQPGQTLWALGEWQRLRSIAFEGYWAHFEFEHYSRASFPSQDGTNQMRVALSPVKGESG